MLACTSVNPHYLEKVVDLAEDSGIEAREDIYSDKGIKLVAKGARISRHTQEKLIAHKLSRPLEASLMLSQQLPADWLLQQAENALSDHQIQLLLGASGQRQALDLLATMDLRQLGAELLIRLMERLGEDALQHGIVVAALAIRLGIGIGLPLEELLRLGMAGLLHDCGKLYLEHPEVDAQQTDLAIIRQVIAHPLLGALALSQLGTLPGDVIDAIRVHHERQDGSGYPHGGQGFIMSDVAQALAIANLIDDNLRQSSHGLAMAETALHLAAGAYEPRLLDEAIRVIQQARRNSPLPDSSELKAPDSYLLPLFLHIGELQQDLAELEEHPCLQNPAAQHWLDRMRRQLIQIQRGFSSTGLDQLQQRDHSDLDPDDLPLRIEVLCIARIIGQRLRELGFIGAQHLAVLPPTSQQAATPWVHLLLKS